MTKKQSQNFPPKADQPQAEIPRPPIVVVMGHVDHGKTTLLDFIRKTNLASREAGGITQSIGAYEIEHNGKKITFVDTPGHQAFSKMRQRGAKLADLGILVVAADESVKAQTKEAIEILKISETPFIVAINKIDKNNADIERTKNDLAQSEVLLEGYGGNVSYQLISAKTGEGVNELLDLILLAAEMENLTYDSQAKATGVILESEMDSRRGLSVSAIVKNGVLKIGDEISTQSGFGKVRILENFLYERVNELAPSSPALILGFEKAPQIGEEFRVGEEFTQDSINQKISQAPELITGSSALNLILKADVSGSLEALSEILQAMAGVKIIDESIGNITDGDVKNAQNNKSIIVGFRVKTTKAAENLAKAQEIKIINSEIIYELIKKIEEMKNTKEPEANSEMTILAVFGKKGKRQIVGGQVNLGSFRNNSNIKIKRHEEIIADGKIINLQKEKQDVKECKETEECGMLVDCDITIAVGDKLIC